MLTAIIDYGSGNLRSASKSFERMARDIAGAEISVTGDPDRVRQADRIVLPGVGAFADCKAGLEAVPGLFEAVEERVLRDAVPFLGICVGMQMLATLGEEHGLRTDGFDWIKGRVVLIDAQAEDVKIPHMGWNALQIEQSHPVLDGLTSGDHAYFVHSYHLELENASDRLSTVTHGGTVTAIVGRDNMIGTQFHPEKSQQTGLQLISNFLRWSP